MQTETRYMREFDDTARRHRWSAVTMVPLPGKWKLIRKLSVITRWTYNLKYGGWYVPAGALETCVSCFDAGNVAGTLLHHSWTRPRRVTKQAIQQQHEKVLAELDDFMRMAEKLPV